MFPVEPDKLDIKRLLRVFLFIMHYEQIDSETNEKQTQFCSNLLMSRMRYEVDKGVTSFNKSKRFYHDQRQY